MTGNNFGKFSCTVSLESGATLHHDKGIRQETSGNILPLETLARRVYELHRSPVPWDALPESRRSELIAAYWRARSGYEAGRTMPRETRIE